MASMNDRNPGGETVVVIAALKVETQLLAAHLEERKESIIGGFIVSDGKLGQNRVIVVLCGMGLARAAAGTRMAIAEFQPDWVVNTGCAGGIGKGVGIGDLVIADRTAQWDLDRTSVGFPGEDARDTNTTCVEADRMLAERLICSRPDSVFVHRGLSVSGNQVVFRDEQRKRIRDKFPDALSVDMESSAIGDVCRRNGVPFAVIRGISDSADASAVSAETAAKVKQAAERAAGVLLNMLSKPK